MADRTIALVNDAIRFELDVAYAYGEASEFCKIAEFRAKLERASIVHGQHATELGALVRARGGEPSTHRNLRGLMMAGSIHIGVDHDDEAARAMRRDEERLTTVFETALFDPQPDDVREAFQRHLAAHRAHLRELDRLIRQHGWQAVPPPWPVP